MKTKWVFVDDDTAVDLIVDEDQIAAQEDLEAVTNEMEDPHYPSGMVPVDIELKLEFSRYHHHRFLDYFHLNLPD